MSSATFDDGSNNLTNNNDKNLNHNETFCPHSNDACDATRFRLTDIDNDNAIMLAAAAAAATTINGDDKAGHQRNSCSCCTSHECRRIAGSCNENSRDDRLERDVKIALAQVLLLHSCHSSVRSFI